MYALMCGRVARAYVHQCFEAVVNINKAVGARPSGRPRLPGGEEREIVLCTLDRAFNPASEAAAPKLARDTWARLLFPEPRCLALPGDSQNSQTTEAPLGLCVCSAPSRFSKAPPRGPHSLPLQLPSPHLLPDGHNSSKLEGTGNRSHSDHFLYKQTNKTLPSSWEMSSVGRMRSLVCSKSWFSLKYFISWAWWHTSIILVFGR